MNGTLPFYECRLTGGDTMRGVGTLKPYLMQKNLFELFALTGRGIQKLWAQTLVPSLVLLLMPRNKVPSGGIYTT